MCREQIIRGWYESKCIFRRHLHFDCISKEISKCFHKQEREIKERERERERVVKDDIKVFNLSNRRMYLLFTLTREREETKDFWGWWKRKRRNEARKRIKYQKMIKISTIKGNVKSKRHNLIY